MPNGGIRPACWGPLHERYGQCTIKATGLSYTLYTLHVIVEQELSPDPWFISYAVATQNNTAPSSLSQWRKGGYIHAVVPTFESYVKYYLHILSTDECAWAVEDDHGIVDPYSNYSGLSQEKTGTCLELKGNKYGQFTLVATHKVTGEVHRITTLVEQTLSPDPLVLQWALNPTARVRPSDDKFVLVPDDGPMHVVAPGVNYKHYLYVEASDDVTWSYSQDVKVFSEWGTPNSQSGKQFVGNLDGNHGTAILTATHAGGEVRTLTVRWSPS